MTISFVTKLAGSTPDTLPAPIAYATTLLVNSGAGALYRCTLTGNVTIAAPLNPTDGDRVKFWLLASGGAWTLSLSGIVIPTTSSFTSGVALTTGKKAKVMLEYDASLNGGQWELTSFINGF
jgi:hypothetical protein